jgi:signal transduction histidine kinase
MRLGRLALFRRIAWQLPLAIAGLLLIVVLLFSWAAYREVRHAVVSAAGDRLNHAALQLATLMGQGNQLQLANTRRIAGNPAIIEALRSRGREAAAAAALRQFADSITNQPIVLELFAANGSLVTGARNSRADTVPATEASYPGWAGDSSAVSGLRASGNRVWYDLAVPVVSADSVTLGYLVQRRWLTANPQAARVLGDLMGSDSAGFLVGVPGGVWTDLARVVSPPPFEQTRQPRVYQRDGDRIGVGRPVGGTSWLLQAELPARPVLARAEAFVGRVTPVGIVIVLIGAVMGWALSGRITTPLGRVRQAAVALADGDLEQQVVASGPYELRELAESFNAMARQIGAAHHGLEVKVAERTAALSHYANQLEAVNQELEAFSYSVSHDLRAPLRAIHGFSQAILDDVGPSLPPEPADHLRRVKAAADRMALLIDDLLELSRVARSEIRIEPVDLTQMAHKVAADLRHGTPGRQTDIRISDGLAAAGDQRLLRLALQNLLDNAWKFTSREPAATIEFGSTNGAETVFFVRDTGAGFDMTYADKLFGVFQRLHTPNEFPGTGVGLAIVQRVVQRHGGRIWAQGSPGKGATFYFTLPDQAVRG